MGLECGFCGKPLQKAKNRNKMEKRFCGDRCRWAYHNKKRFDAFTNELLMLLKKYGFIKDIDAFGQRD